MKKLCVKGRLICHYPPFEDCKSSLHQFCTPFCQRRRGNSHLNLQSSTVVILDQGHAGLRERVILPLVSQHTPISIHIHESLPTSIFMLKDLDWEVALVLFNLNPYLPVPLAAAFKSQNLRMSMDGIACKYRTPCPQSSKSILHEGLLSLPLWQVLVDSHTMYCY